MPEVLAHIALTVLVALGALGINIRTLFTEANTAIGVNEYTIAHIATPFAGVIVLVIVMTVLVFTEQLVFTRRTADHATAVRPDPLLSADTLPLWLVAELAHAVVITVAVAVTVAITVAVLVNVLVVARLLWTATIADPLVTGPRASQASALVLAIRAGDGHFTLVGVLTNGPTGRSIFTGQ